MYENLNFSESISSEEDLVVALNAWSEKEKKKNENLRRNYERTCKRNRYEKHWMTRAGQNVVVSPCSGKLEAEKEKVIIYRSYSRKGRKISIFETIVIEKAINSVWNEIK